MIAFPPGAKVWLAGGATDMRKGMNGLALMVQQGLGRDPHGGRAVLLPRPTGAADEGAVARRGGDVALREAARPRAVHLADAGGRSGVGVGGAARLPARRHRLAEPAAHLAAVGGRVTIVGLRGRFRSTHWRSAINSGMIPDPSEIDALRTTLRRPKRAPRPPRRRSSRRRGSGRFGLEPDHTPGPSYEPGMELRGKYVLIAEGVRGSRRGRDDRERDRIPPPRLRAGPPSGSRWRSTRPAIARVVLVASEKDADPAGQNLSVPVSRVVLPPFNRTPRRVDGRV